MENVFQCFSIPESENDELTLFFFIKRMLFPGILVWLNTDLVTYPKDINDEYEMKTKLNLNSSYESLL